MSIFESAYPEAYAGYNSRLDFLLHGKRHPEGYLRIAERELPRFIDISYVTAPPFHPIQQRFVR